MFMSTIHCACAVRSKLVEADSIASRNWKSISFHRWIVVVGGGGGKDVAAASSFRFAQFDYFSCERSQLR